MKQLLLLLLVCPPLAFAEDFSGTWEALAHKESDSCKILKDGIKEKLVFNIKQIDADSLEIVDSSKPDIVFKAKKLPLGENNFQGEQRLGGQFDAVVRVHFWKTPKETKMWRTNYTNGLSGRCEVMFLGLAKKTG